MDAGRHQYAITWGSPELRDALAKKISRDTGRPVDAQRELVVTCGATEALIVAMMTVCDPGDRVGMFSPFYESYNADAILSGATPVHVRLNPPHYGFDPAELRAAFAGGLKAFVLCNPSNPSGRVFTRDELMQIAALAEEFDTFVITDEVYEHITFAPHRHTYFATLPGMAARTLSCSALSKTFLITGWRLGHVWASPELIAQARKVHDFLTVGAAAPLQHAVVAALNFPPSYYAALGPDYAARRDLLCGWLDRTGLSYTRPEGSYFVMLDVSPLGCTDDVAFSKCMAREVGVAPVPGSKLLPVSRAPLCAAELREICCHAERRRRAAAKAETRLIRSRLVGVMLLCKSGAFTSRLREFSIEVPPPRISFGPVVPNHFPHANED
jgi:aminotransferase